MLTPVLILLSLSCSASMKTEEPHKWVLTFSDEFSGPKGQAPDTSKWGRDLGKSGWGNNELEEYTDGTSNAYLDGKGNLIIEAKKSMEGGKASYTSARLLTKGKFSQAYGRFEVKAKLPFGKGIWPAIWMLGDGPRGWPACGEIDIMEQLGHEPTLVHGTLHGPGYSASNGKSSTLDLKSLPASRDGFHVYSVDWEPERIQWFVDGKLYHTVTPNEIGVSEWVFNHPFYVILNLAVGGGWPGYPDDTTTFPQKFEIAYVRVYRDENLKIDEALIKKNTAERMVKNREFKGAKTVSLPGTVQSVDFMEGGEGVGYHDVDPQNQGGAYRPTEGVDIGASNTSGFKYSVGWTKAGEWLAYAVDVTEAGSYDLELMEASEGNGGTLHFELDGKDVTGPIHMPNTGGWSNWKPIQKKRIQLPVGKHVLKIRMDTNGETNSVGNIGPLKFTKS